MQHFPSNASSPRMSPAQLGSSDGGAPRWRSFVSISTGFLRFYEQYDDDFDCWTSFDSDMTMDESARDGAAAASAEPSTGAGCAAATVLLALWRWIWF